MVCEAHPTELDKKTGRTVQRWDGAAGWFMVTGVVGTLKSASTKISIALLPGQVFRGHFVFEEEVDPDLVGNHQGHEG